MALALCALAGISACAAETLPDGFPTTRGIFTFFRAEMLAKPEQYAPDLKWLSNFDILFTNGPGLAGETTRKTLQERGCKLFIYFWTNAFYEFKLGATQSDGYWRDHLAEQHKDWFLSPQPLPTLTEHPAYYFDLTNDDLVTYLCRQLASFRAHTGYDGIFFDYAGIYGLPEKVADVWKQRHPDVPYDQALAAMFRRLREVDPGVLIFTNQAYQSDAPLLAEVDYDLGESLGTSFAWGPEVETEDGTLKETYFRPWPGDFGIEGLYGLCEQRLSKAPVRKHFLYLDYMRPRYQPAEEGKPATELDLEAVYYSYCAAALWGRASFCSGWYAGHEYRGPLYFADLGKPLGEDPLELKGVVVREYERGIVALMMGTEAVDVEFTPQTGGAGIYDLFASAWLRNGGDTVRFQLNASHSELSGADRPAARVYLKAPSDQ